MSALTIIQMLIGMIGRRRVRPVKAVRSWEFLKNMTREA